VTATNVNGAVVALLARDAAPADLHPARRTDQRSAPGDPCRATGAAFMAQLDFFMVNIAPYPNGRHFPGSSPVAVHRQLIRPRGPKK
jgi:hypothetical protein